MELTRPATAEEIKDYMTIENLLADCTDEEWDKVFDMTAEAFWTALKTEKERKRDYNRLYRYAKKHELTVKTFINWYLVDED